ncbi:hypothetical protein SSTU70S_01095 [Stutzerimonas stutzeri]
MPVQQLRRVEQPAAGVVRIDHHQHVELLQRTRHAGFAQLHQRMAFALPGGGVFGVTGGDDTTRARRRRRQGLDRRLRTGHRQQVGAAVVVPRHGWQVVVGSGRRAQALTGMSGRVGV